MPKRQTLGEYLNRQSVYVLSDGERCLYVGQTSTGRAGVASRITNHLTNAANKTKRFGLLHSEINASGKTKDWHLDWSLEIYSVAECEELTKKTLRTPKEAEAEMIKHLNPICNV